jgi:hypothetical protein
LYDPTGNDTGRVHPTDGARGRQAARPELQQPDGAALPAAAGVGAVIPTRRDQRRSPRFDRAAYRRRNVVERLINRLKQFRRVANYLAMLTIAAIILWL